MYSNVPSERLLYEEILIESFGEVPTASDLG